MTGIKQKTASKKNINIELIRVVACFFVVAIHLLTARMGPQNITTHYIKIILIIAVPLFWIVTGYYIFTDKKPYFKKVKKTITGILVPALIVMFFSQVFSSWILCKTSFLYCIKHPQFNSSVFRGLLGWYCSGTLVSHLWYIFAYLRLILFFPLFRYICRNSKTENKIRRAYLLLFFVQAIISNIQYIVLPIFNIKSGINIPMPFDANIFYVLLGYEINLFINREKNDSNKTLINYRIIFAGVVGFLATVLGFTAIYICKKLGLDTVYFLSLKTCISMVLSVCVFYIIMHIKIKKCFNAIIIYLSKNSFYIYLIHMIVEKKLTKIYWLKNYMKNFNPWVSYLFYLIITLILANVISTLIIKITLFIKLIKNHLFSHEQTT